MKSVDSESRIYATGQQFPEFNTGKDESEISLDDAGTNKQLIANDQGFDESMDVTIDPIAITHSVARELSSGVTSDMSAPNSSSTNSVNLSSEEDSVSSMNLQLPNVESIVIGMDKITQKYYFKAFDHEQSVIAQFFLRNFGLKHFLNAYLPSEVVSLHFYYLIKLLGYEIKDQNLLTSIYAAVEIYDDDVDMSNIVFEELIDPLEAKLIGKIFRQFQKVVMRVIASERRIPKYISPDNFANLLQKSQKIIVLTGAGISTSLGIPDFRSSMGFYSKIKHLGLDDPQDVFNYKIFEQNPSVFYNIAHLVLPPENIYSPLHSFLRLLQDQGKLLRNYTQNIDNLEAAAGLSPESIVQCHGSFATASCFTCNYNVPGHMIFDSIRNTSIPLCPKCSNLRQELLLLKQQENLSYESGSDEINVLKSFGVLKPDITFFGEPLPEKFHDLIEKDIKSCDLLICIGTSLKVAPVSEIVNLLPPKVPRILMNKDPIRHINFDLSLLGYCDDVATFMAQKCGWEIPHKNWAHLSTTKFDLKKTEEGIYKITGPGQSADIPTSN